jgi:hypothetical protein
MFTPGAKAPPPLAIAVVDMYALRCAIGTVRFALARGQRRERAAELVDLFEQLVEQGFDVAAYLIEHG